MAEKVSAVSHCERMSLAPDSVLDRTLYFSSGHAYGSEVNRLVCQCVCVRAGSPCTLLPTREL